MKPFDEYAKAALALKRYADIKPIVFETPDALIDSTRHGFFERFSPENLSKLSGSELLDAIFSGKQSLCYQLEFNPTIKRYFGSISGGSAYKFGLFQKQEDRNWMTGSPNSPIVLSENEAIVLAGQIRDCLVKGHTIIALSALDAVDDYDKLNERLSSELGQYATYAWFQKYFYMSFPEKLVGWYTVDWLEHFLYGLGIIPKSNYYSLNGQLTFVKRSTGFSYKFFQELCYQIFGERKNFYRLALNSDDSSQIEHWISSGKVAIGWSELSDLINYVKSGVIERKGLATKMESLFFNGDAQTAFRVAGEVKAFYETKSNDVFVVVDGEKLIGLADNISPYYYDSNEPLSHIKKVSWSIMFPDVCLLPVSEGSQQVCVEIKMPENLRFLYSKYYRQFELTIPETDSAHSGQVDTKYVVRAELPKRLPRNTTRFPLNSILYGAPGTGKTYATKEYALAIINDTDMSDSMHTKEKHNAILSEYNLRVKKGQILFTTFHQSYGYEDFIQGLRPVTNTDFMKFENSDGIFKRIADKAMHDNNENYVIIIDEINRANISKVFGELITLIEEDKRWGEANEMSATLPSGDVLAIPNNLYIIGTMNSADKSISLIDAALRRRFDFIETTPNVKLIENAVLSQVLKKLNDELMNELDSTDLLIGHAYFFGKSEEELVNVMNRNIVPLLYEYFFDNSRKVKAVINKALEGLEYKVEEGNVGRVRIARNE